jgi:hypothetical protein
VLIESLPTRDVVIISQAWPLVADFKLASARSIAALSGNLFLILVVDLRQFNDFRRIIAHASVLQRDS